MDMARLGEPKNACAENVKPVDFDQFQFSEAIRAVGGFRAVVNDPTSRRHDPESTGDQDAAGRANE
jgi:hypothetical protein